MNCNCKLSCTLWALIVGILVGVLTAFFQITGAITVTAAFLWVVLGIAVVYLFGLTVASLLVRPSCKSCKCGGLGAVLIGILGSVLLSVILLAFGVTATSVVSAILAGLLLFFLTLTLTGAACLVRCLNDCVD